MNLIVRQLATFRAVIQAGSISEAARWLGRKQPAVSVVLPGLERGRLRIACHLASSNFIVSRVFSKRDWM